MGQGGISSWPKKICFQQHIHIISPLYFYISKQQYTFKSIITLHCFKRINETFCYKKKYGWKYDTSHKSPLLIALTRSTLSVLSETFVLSNCQQVRTKAEKQGGGGNPVHADEPDQSKNLNISFPVRDTCLYFWLELEHYILLFVKKNHRPKTITLHLTAI